MLLQLVETRIHVKGDWTGVVVWVEVSESLAGGGVVCVSAMYVRSFVL